MASPGDCDFLLGIDFGGTKIEAAALNADGATLARLRVPTPRQDYARCVEAVVELVGQIEVQLGGRGSVGLAVPGAISPATGLMKNANSAWLNGRAFDRDLEQALSRPVRLENDANCFALSEASDGAGAGARVVFGVILGTGVGGGLVIGGALAVGRNRIAGEWGHNPLPWPTPAETPGPQCWCGKAGCNEVWLSGPGLAADHQRRSGRALSAKQVIEQARGGEASACATFEAYRARLGRGLAQVVNIVDPDVIVLGGGLSAAPELYEALSERLAPWVFSERCDTPIVPNKHGDSSGVRGAAWLWRQ